MKFSKISKILASTALIAGTLIHSPKISNADFYFWGELRGNNNTTSNYNARIKHVPEHIRNVPKHPDDSYAEDKNVAPIVDSGFELPLKTDDFSLELGIGGGFRKGLFDFRLGPKLTTYSVYNNYSPKSPESSFPIKERNYTNHPGTDIRGVGAALTYYGFNTNVNSYNQVYNYGPSARTSLVFDLSEGNNVLLFKPFIEYSAIFSPKQNFFIETGWDRYNSLETKNTYQVASGLVNHIVKAGINFNILLFNLELYSGVEIPKILKKTQLADEIGFNFNSKPNYFFGFSTGIYFDTLSPKN